MRDQIAILTRPRSDAPGFSCVLADPPWPERGGGKIKRGADRHYELMSVCDIIKMPVASICAPDAHCWMWVTNNYLPDGLRAMSAWGFRYISNVAWGKVSSKTGLAQIGMGQYLRGSHELLLFGVRGKMPPAHRGAGIDARTYCTLQLHERTKHSRKPDTFYDLIEAVSGDVPRIELFGRRVRDGWIAMGNDPSLDELGGLSMDVPKGINELAHNRELLRDFTSRR